MIARHKMPLETQPYSGTLQRGTMDSVDPLLLGFLPKDVRNMFFPFMPACNWGLY